MRNKCNGKGACIIVIKIEESGNIIGGNNPFGWKYNYGYSKNYH